MKQSENYCNCCNMTALCTFLLGMKGMASVRHSIIYVSKGLMTKCILSLRAHMQSNAFFFLYSE